MNTIRVNGKVIEVPDGASVSVADGKVIIGDQIKMSGLSGDVKLEIIGNPLNIRSTHNIVVDGNVQGDVNAAGNVICGNVQGSVDAWGNVACGSIGGDVDAGGNVTGGKR